MARRRYLHKFTSFDEEQEYVFSPARYEYESSQALVSPRSTVPGLSYPLRSFGYGLSPKDIAQERVRCVVYGAAEDIDSELDDMRSKLYLGAFGWVWTLGADGTYRRARAELADMPQVTISYASPGITPVIMGFNRFTPWFTPALLTQVFSINASPTEVMVINPGNTRAVWMMIRIRANTATGFTNPSIQNLQNGYLMGTTRDAVSSNSEVRFDTERKKIEFSNDDGANYSNDYANRVFGVGQVEWFVLEPGNNNLWVTSDGTPSFDLEIAFYPAWE